MVCFHCIFIVRTVIVEIFNTIDSLKRATGINVVFYINVSFIYLRS